MRSAIDLYRLGSLTQPWAAHKEGVHCMAQAVAASGESVVLTGGADFQLKVTASTRPASQALSASCQPVGRCGGADGAVRMSLTALIELRRERFFLRGSRRNARGGGRCDGEPLRRRPYGESNK